MTDLTDRMRTCAAHVIASTAHEYDDEIGRVMRDAAELLIEASTLLEAATPPPDLGEPMEIIPPVIAQSVTLPTDLWIAPGGPLPTVSSGTVSPRACPRCDSRAGKRVYREGNMLMLECPVCANMWEFSKKPPAMTGG